MFWFVGTITNDEGLSEEIYQYYEIESMDLLMVVSVKTIKVFDLDTFLEFYHSANRL